MMFLTIEKYWERSAAIPLHASSPSNEPTQDKSCFQTKPIDLRWKLDFMKCKQIMEFKKNANEIVKK